jgi:hypothetical protein
MDSSPRNTPDDPPPSAWITGHDSESALTLRIFKEVTTSCGALVQQLVITQQSHVTNRVRFCPASLSPFP